MLWRLPKHPGRAYCKHTMRIDGPLRSVFDVFTKRLQGQAAALAKKSGVRMVRFQVEVSGTQVSLKPVLIR